MKRMRRGVALGVTIALLVGIGVALIDYHDNQAPRRKSVLTPLQSGDLATTKAYVVLRTRGRTITELAHQFDVQPTMDAVVNLITRGVSVDLRETAKRLCERELNRSERAKGMS